MAPVWGDVWGDEVVRRIAAPAAGLLLVMVLVVAGAGGGAATRLVLLVSAVWLLVGLATWYGTDEEDEGAD